jgi:thiosulfate/3-mercaptopyruvate sulfurtransferase
MTIRTISTADLAQRLGDPDLVIVDVRPMAAYNGWRLQGEARGGHIRGAVACPLAWAHGVKVDVMKTLLGTKGITPDKTIVVYGYTPDESAPMAAMLGGMGYKDVFAYEAGLGEWAADDSLPMSCLANYERLVHPEWLHSLIHGERVEAHPQNGFALFHVNFGVPEDYHAGHVPGAAYLDTNVLETDTTWNRRSSEELEAALLAHGITHDKTVVLYGRYSTPNPVDDPHPGQKAGQIAATRAAAILMYAGVEDVRLMDGAFNAWVAAGYEIDTQEHIPTPAQTFGAEIPVRPDYMVDIDEAKELIADPGGVLVSIRSWPEFIGENSGYHYIGPKGRIAGAVWGNCGTDAYHMQNYRNMDNTMREYHEIEVNWREMGITPDKRVAFYCGTGWRASETFFYAYLMGWPSVAVYDGGWYEWSQDPSNPIERGVPQELA